MKFKTGYTLSGLFIVLLFLAYGLLNAQDQKGEKSDFSNVDVVVNCDWGATDKVENVSVFDQSNAKEPHLTIYEANGETFEIILAKGIKVSVIDHKSHKLLKTYVGKYVKK
jgi:hypothetical protein